MGRTKHNLGKFVFLRHQPSLFFWPQCAQLGFVLLLLHSSGRIKSRILSSPLLGWKTTKPEVNSRDRFEDRAGDRGHTCALATYMSHRTLLRLLYYLPCYWTHICTSFCLPLMPMLILYGCDLLAFDFAHVCRSRTVEAWSAWHQGGPSLLRLPPAP